MLKQQAPFNAMQHQENKDLSTRHSSRHRLYSEEEQNKFDISFLNEYEHPRFVVRIPASAFFKLSVNYTEMMKVKKQRPVMIVQFSFIPVDKLIQKIKQCQKVCTFLVEKVNEELNYNKNVPKYTKTNLTEPTPLTELVFWEICVFR